MTFDPLLICHATTKAKTNAQTSCKLFGKGEFCLLKVDQDVILSQSEASATLPAGGFALFTNSVLLLPQSKCTYTLLSLHGQAAQDFAAGLPQLWVGHGKHVDDAVRRLLQQGETGGKAVHSALAYSLLCAVHNALERGASSPHLPPLVACAIDAIQQNYAGVYGVEELAEELGVSKSHLVRAFSAAMGTSPGRYLTSVRVDAAKFLILQRPYTLQTVASLCGFSSTHYFCKVFKKVVGVSPTEWKAENMQTSFALPAGPASMQEDMFYL